MRRILSWKLDRALAVDVPSWLAAPGVALCFVSLAAFFLLGRVTEDSPYDLTVYLMGGDAFRGGLPVYDQAIQSQWGLGYFTYPPITLLVFAPLSLLSQGTAFAVLLTAGLAALFGVCWTALRMAGCRAGAGTVGLALGISGCAIWLQPIFDSMIQGQVNVILILLVLADFHLGGRRRWPMGVLIGVAAAVKITPAIFVVYLLLTRRYRAAATAAITAAALTAVGFLVAGRDSVDFWFRGTFMDSTRVASPLTNDSVFNQSIHGVAIRLLGDHTGALVWVVLAAAVAVLGFWTAVTARRADGDLAGVLSCAVTGLLISPLTWHEHWAWIVPVSVWLAAFAMRLHRHLPITAGAIPALVVLPFLMWPQPAGPPGDVVPASILGPARNLWESEGNHNPLVAMAGATYVLVGLTLLIAGALLLLLRNRRAAGGADDPAAEDGDRTPALQDVR